MCNPAARTEDHAVFDLPGWHFRGDSRCEGRNWREGPEGRNWREGPEGRNWREGRNRRDGSPTGPAGPAGPAGSAGPAGPSFTQWHTGKATIAAGSNSIAVSITAFTGSPDNYSVTATFSQAVNWGSDNSTVPVLVITSETVTGFTIEVVNDTGGVLKVPSGGVTVNWIAIPQN